MLPGVSDDPKPALQPSRASEEPAGELFREAVDETRELVRLEVALAREEMRSELRQAMRAAMGFGFGALAAIAAFTMLLVALATTFTREWLAALVMAAALAGVAAAAVALGWLWRPRRPLGDTRQRIGRDLRGLKERIV